MTSAPCAPAAVRQIPMMKDASAWGGATVYGFPMPGYSGRGESPAGGLGPDCFIFRLFVVSEGIFPRKGVRTVTP